MDRLHQRGSLTVDQDADTLSEVGIRFTAVDLEAGQAIHQWMLNLAQRNIIEPLDSPTAEWESLYRLRSSVESPRV
ncbi:hypothetical protein ASD81_11150 [Nocardioides sp. Root614]|nr:hypothetical protein ASD81_11150 [Nocardioides sp. Root614]KRA93056.1 hypothetical protein ASD84_11415 [Nocardioides sp. Root682]